MAFGGTVSPVIFHGDQFKSSKEAPSGKGYFIGDFVLSAAGVKDTKRLGGERSVRGFFVFGNPTDPLPKSEVFPAQ
jgi:hypothetical protein